MRSPVKILVAGVAAAALITGCGGDDQQAASMDHSTMGQASPTAGETTGAAVDRAFATAMIPHHESAIEMAEIAQERGQSAFVKQLAADIIKAQESEIETLKRIDAALAAKGVKPGDLGVAEPMMGMDGSTAELRSADPFDSAFIDMMTPHHEGAVKMAEAELKRGENAELKTLAAAIVKAQNREIEEMKAFRKKEFGASASASPATPGSTATPEEPPYPSSGESPAHATPDAVNE